MSGESVNAGNSLSEVVDKLKKFADPSLAESWDNVGLLIEPFTEKLIKNILLTNDLTENVMQEAIDKKIDLIVSYHPPIFSALKRITKASWKERIVAACLENRIAVYSPHTSWDAVASGVNDWLADTFIDHIKPNGKSALVPSPSSCDLQKLSVIHSLEPLDKIVKDYSFIKILNRSKCGDLDVGTLLCDGKDFQQLKNIDGIKVGVLEFKDQNVLNKQVGMGRILQVANLNIADCVQLIKKQTGLPFVRLALARGKTQETEVSTIALVAGSGGSLLKNVKADLFVTGEMFHHDVLNANHMGISVILTNHSDSERGFLKSMEKHLCATFENNVKVYISSTDCDPLRTV